MNNEDSWTKHKTYVEFSNGTKVNFVDLDY